MSILLVFGDSITWGAWDKKGGWAQRLKSFGDQKNLTEEAYDCQVYTLGVSGDTTEDVLERMEAETRARLGDSQIIMVFAIGLNDSQLSNNDARVPLEQFRENLGMLAEKSKQFSSQIVFLGLTPVDDAKVNPIPWAPEKSYRNERVQKYNAMLRHFCEEEDLHFVELFESLTRENYTALLEDGVHPNTKGHEKLFDIVRDFLEKHKIL